MSIRILHVIGRLGKGGDSIAVFNSIKHMNANEYKIDFLTHIGYDEMCAKRLEEQGHRVIVLDGDVRKLGPIKYYLNIKKAIKDNGDYDIIHMHTSAQSGVGLLAAKHIGIGKRICHSHVNNVQRKINMFQEKFYLPVLRKLIDISATHKVACGSDAGKYLFGKNNNFSILTNGINLKKFTYTDTNIDLKQVLKLSEDEIILGHVGRFIDMKNQSFIIDILKNLSLEGIKYKCLFLGEGETIEEVKRKSNELGVIDKCLFLGRKDNVYEYMQLMDILLLPSLKGEGFPTVLVEGQAANSFCIISDLVTKDIDLDLGLTKFCSIENLKEWVTEIKLYQKNNKLSRNTIYTTLKSKNFDSQDSVRMWENLYSK